MLNQKAVVQQSDDILGGALVFAGTRVPVHTLIDYLSAGDSIDEFLDDSQVSAVNKLFRYYRPLNKR